MSIGPFWTKVDEEKLKSLVIQKEPNLRIARALGRSLASIEGKIKQLRFDPEFNAAVESRKASYTKDVISWVKPLQNTLSVRGNRFLTGDWHLDRHWVELVQRLFDEARWSRRHGEKCGLVIAGDFLNGECYSSYAKGRSTSSGEDEFRAAEVMVDRLLTVFRDIEIILGNHDARLILALQNVDSRGDLPHQRIARMFLPETQKGRVKVGNYYWMTLNDRWRITHPKAYSRTAGTTGRALAVKFQTNVSVAHEHHLGWCKDPSNRYQIINQGCMIDPRKAEYSFERDSTAPEWTPGFVKVLDDRKEVTLYDGVEGYKVKIR